MAKTILSFLLFLGTTVVCGEATSASKPNDVPHVSNLLEIALEPSRPLPTAGDGLDIIATVKNSSSDPILICEHTTTVTSPTEIDQSQEVGLNWARFTVDSNSAKNGDEDFKGVLVLQPGQSTHVFWSVNNSPLGNQRSQPTTTWMGQISQQIDNELGYLFFPPGDYKFAVQMKYWPLKGQQQITKEQLLESNYQLPGYQNAIAIMSVRVGAPIMVILFGASIGGLAAYLLKQTQPSSQDRGLPGTENPAKPEWGLSQVAQPQFSIGQMIKGVAKNVTSAAGAVLLACIFTILLSRLSETQFPIRVSVSDLWGAVAVGFFGAYSGTSLLQRYIGGQASDNSKRGQTGIPNHPAATTPGSK
jgi:hypothetical protein